MSCWAPSSAHAEDGLVDKAYPWSLDDLWAWKAASGWYPWPYLKGKHLVVPALVGRLFASPLRRRTRAPLYQAYLLPSLVSYLGPWSTASAEYLGMRLRVTIHSLVEILKDCWWCLRIVFLFRRHRMAAGQWPAHIKLLLSSTNPGLCHGRFCGSFLVPNKHMIHKMNPHRVYLLLFLVLRDQSRWEEHDPFHRALCCRVSSPWRWCSIDEELQYHILSLSYSLGLSLQKMSLRVPDTGWGHLLSRTA